MSLLKRAVERTDKSAKPATKAAARRRAATPRTKPKSASDASAEAERLASAIALGIAEGRLDVLTADALQGLLAAACRLYAARREAGETLAPVARNSVSASNVMVTSSGLLRAADLAAFELGMWQGLTGR